MRQFFLIVSLIIFIPAGYSHAQAVTEYGANISMVNGMARKLKQKLAPVPDQLVIEFEGEKPTTTPNQNLQLRRPTSTEVIHP